MAESNPYQTPRSAVSAPSAEYAEIKLISFSGRLGRLRYIAYSFVLSIILAVIMAALGWFIDGNAGAASTQGTVSYSISMLFAFATLVFFVGWTVQRLHDFDASAWWALLMLVPLANVILAVLLWVKAGTPAANRFGNEPPPNTLGVKILAVTMIALVAASFTFFVLFFGLRLFLFVV